jgi:hypothetical protein
MLQSIIQAIQTQINKWNKFHPRQLEKKLDLRRCPLRRTGK